MWAERRLTHDAEAPERAAAPEMVGPR